MKQKTPASLSRKHAILLAILFVAGAGLWHNTSMSRQPEARALLAQSLPEPKAGGMVDLVVDFGDGRLRVDRRDFEAGMTGIDLLNAADVELTTSGAAICAIDGVGCPASDCFCACRLLDECRVWSYHHEGPDGRWSYAQVGPSDFTLEAGAVEGWAWIRREPITTTLTLRSALAGMHWLRDFQAEDGGFAENMGFSIEAVLAARSVGVDIQELRTSPESLSAAEYLVENAAPYADIGPAQAGKALAGLVAADRDPRDAPQTHAALIAVLDQHYHAETGRYGETTWDQSWAVLGLVAAGERLPDEARQALIDMRSADGGWGFGAGEEALDIDSTGLALQALAAAGEAPTSAVLRQARVLLENSRLEAGGWGAEDGAVNLNSTAFALQGLWAADVDPAGAIASIGQITRTQQADGRFQFADEPSDLTDLVASLQVLPALSGRSLALPGPAVGMRRGAEWLVRQQEADGGFGGFGPGSSIDVVLALNAAGHHPDPEHASGMRASDYLVAAAEAYAGQGASTAGKLAVGVVALDMDPRALGPTKIDLVSMLLEAQDADSGAFGGGTTWDQSWAMLGLVAAGEPVSDAAIAYLREAARPQGGWGFEARAEEADADSTGLALQALIAAGHPTSDYYAWLGANTLQDLQLPDAGWGFGGSTSVSSTALAIGGLVAMDHAVDGAGWMRGGPDTLLRHTPREAILLRQAPGGGFEGFGGPEDLSATSAAVLGLSRKALPLPPWSAPEPPVQPVYLPLLEMGG